VGGPVKAHVRKGKPVCLPHSTPYVDLMDASPDGALARWQVNLKRYAIQIQRDYPTAAETLRLVCREMETARKALKKNQRAAQGSSHAAHR